MNAPVPRMPSQLTTKDLFSGQRAVRHCREMADETKRPQVVPMAVCTILSASVMPDAELPSS